MYFYDRQPVVDWDVLSCLIGVSETARQDIKDMFDWTQFC